MKYYTTFILCFLLPIIFCDELGGIKAGINDKFISNLIRHFEPEIRKVLERVSIPNGKKLTNGVLRIPNFNMNMINLEILNNGIVHIRIQNCIPHVTGTVHYQVIFKYKKEFTAKLKNFVLDANIRIKSRPVSGGGYGPDIEFISGPNMNFKLDISLKGFGGKIMSWFINTFQMFKSSIIKEARSSISGFLHNFLNKLEPKIRLYKNYWLDFTFVTPIKTQNRILELNSYGLFYSDKNRSTQNRNRLPLTPMPSINTLEKNLKLYVSEYSINNAIYTLLSDSNNVLPVKIKTNMLEMAFPGIVGKYGEKQATIILSGSPNSKIKIVNQNLEAEVSGTFGLKIDGIQNEVFKCALDISLKGYVKIKEGPKLSGEIKEFKPKITKTFVNQVSNKIMETGISSIESTIIPILNGFIEDSLEIKFPTVMGISFTNISLELKNKYIVINYDITRDKQQDGNKPPIQYGAIIKNCDKVCKNKKSRFDTLVCIKCKSLLSKKS